MELILSILIGIGLSVSAGFRVFTPLLITNIASNTSFVTLAEGFDWIGSTPAFIAFLTATIIEVFSYYIPIVDHLSKLIATPAAIIAGTMLTASFISDMSPFFTWSVAIIAGGGAASLSQVATGSMRGASTIATGGMGNFVVSIFEGISAVVLSVLSIFFPILSIVLIGLIVFLFIKVIKKVKSSALRKKVSVS